MAQDRNYSAGTRFLELDGVVIGGLHAVSGGEPFGIVVDDASSLGGSPGKHISHCEYAPIEMTFGIGMDSRLFSWIAEWLGGRPTPRTGAVVLSNYTGQNTTRLEFHDASLIAVEFDTFRGESKEPWLISVIIAPTSTQRVESSAPAPKLQGKRRSALSSNYRLNLTGLPTMRVSKVTLPRATASELDEAVHAGPRTMRTSAPPSLTNLTGSLSAADQSAYFQLVDDFVVQGNNGPGKELAGSLDVLSPDLKSTLLTITMQSLGIVRAAPQRYESGSEVLRRIDVEFYCEGMGIVVPKEDSSAAADTATSSQPTSGGFMAGEVTARLSSALLALLAESRFDATRLQVAEGLLTRAGLLVPAPETVASRLVKEHAGLPESAGQLRRDQGSAIGQAWAEQRATLEELQALARLDSADWDAVGLSAGHSLLVDLGEAGVIAAEEGAPVDLERDPFVEGLVAGAAEVLRRVSPHLSR